MEQTCGKNSSTSASFMTDHHYSDAIYDARVLLLGPMPPPWGGIAVHIQRLALKLKAQRNTVFHIDTITRTGFVTYLVYLVRTLWVSKAAYLIYHTPYTKYASLDMMLLLIYARLKGARLVIVEHDCRYIAPISWIAKKIRSFLYRCADSFVFMGTATYASYKKAGIVIANVMIESPFLPPDTNQKYDAYPAAVLAFVQSHKPLLVANAYQCILVDGKDLYGIDESIRLIQKLKTTFPQVGLLFFLATMGDRAYYQKIIKDADEHVYFLTGDYPLFPIFKHADCFIRPTRNENFGISVAEACYCKVPVIASDVCERPQAAVLYRAADSDDFFHKINTVLQKEMYEK